MSYVREPPPPLLRHYQLQSLVPHSVTKIFQPVPRIYGQVTTQLDSPWDPNVNSTIRMSRTQNSHLIMKQMIFKSIDTGRSQSIKIHSIVITVLMKNVVTSILIQLFFLHLNFPRSSLFIYESLILAVIPDGFFLGWL